MLKGLRIADIAICSLARRFRRHYQAVKVG